jgi:hypothetical protein
MAAVRPADRLVRHEDVEDTHTSAYTEDEREDQMEIAQCAAPGTGVDRDALFNR